MHDEIKSFLPKVELTRREFTVATLATGFALAVQPVVHAQVITPAPRGSNRRGQLLGTRPVAPDDPPEALVGYDQWHPKPRNPASYYRPIPYIRAG